MLDFSYFEGFAADAEEDVVEFEDEVVVLGVDAAVVNGHVEHRCVPMDAYVVGEMELEADSGVAGLNDDVKGGVGVVVVNVFDYGFTEIAGFRTIEFVEELDAFDFAAG